MKKTFPKTDITHLAATAPPPDFRRPLLISIYVAGENRTNFLWRTHVPIVNQAKCVRCVVVPPSHYRFIDAPVNVSPKCTHYRSVPPPLSLSPRSVLPPISVDSGTDGARGWYRRSKGSVSRWRPTRTASTNHSSRVVSTAPTPQAS